MSASDGHDQLAVAIDAEARALEALCAAMASSRTLYVALRASELAAALAPLDAAAATVRSAGERRARLAAALAPAGLQALLDAVPRARSAPLRRALERARAAARALRVENALGARLLEFARGTQESLLRAVAGASAGAKVYDCHARAVAARGESGNLISGKL